MILVTSIVINVKKNSSTLNVITVNISNCNNNYDNATYLQNVQ